MLGTRTPWPRLPTWCTPVHNGALHVPAPRPRPCFSSVSATRRAWCTFRMTWGKRRPWPRRSACPARFSTAPARPPKSSCGASTSHKSLPLCTSRNARTMALRSRQCQWKRTGTETARQHPPPRWPRRSTTFFEKGCGSTKQASGRPPWGPSQWSWSWSPGGRARPSTWRPPCKCWA